MANIAALLKRIESGTLSYEEKLSALSQVEQSLQDMRQKKQEAIQSNVMLIVDALKQMQVKVEQQLEEAKAIVPQKGQKGDRGEKGDRGLDGSPGKDGRDGINGKDGKDGKDGISVTDAKIDFDGSLVITLSNGREINVGEVLPLDVSDKIKVIANGGGTSQTVVDTLTSLQNQINTLTGIDGVLGDMAQQNANNVAITGGAINGATIGGVTPAAGTFTTLTATGQTSLGGAAGSESLRVLSNPSYTSWVEARGSSTSNPGIRSSGTGTLQFDISAQSGGSVRFYSSSYTTQQFQISHTASAVNYVQVTGAATGSGPIVSAQGSDTNVDLLFSSKGTAGSHVFRTNSTVRQFQINHVTSAVNYGVVTGSISGNAVPFTVAGSDTNIGLNLTTKGTGALSVNTGNGEALRVADLGGTVVAGLGVFAGSSSQNSAYLVPYGSVTNGNILIASKGTAFVGLGTNTSNNSTVTEQLRVSHTASAVNYVQVTGAATTAAPSLSVAGSDTNIAFTITPKGTGAINLSGTTRIGFNAANYLNGAGAATGLTPTLSALGTDTNIDLALTPKGTGNVRFGTYTANMALTIQGYIEIKDSGGTVRKLAVIA